MRLLVNDKSGQFTMGTDPELVETKNFNQAYNGPLESDKQAITDKVEQSIQS